VKQSEFDAALVALGLVFAAAIALVAWGHLSPWLLTLPVGILVIGIVYTLLEDLGRRR
jgi:hypothetical protein